MYFITCLGYSVITCFDFFSSTGYTLKSYNYVNSSVGMKINETSFFYTLLITNDIGQNLQDLTEYKYLFNITQSYVSINNFSRKVLNTSFSSSCSDKKNISIFNLIKLDIKNFICFQIPNQVIEGDFTDDNFKFLQINISINETEFYKNFNNEEYFEKIFLKENFKASLYFSDYDFNYNTLDPDI